MALVLNGSTNTIGGLAVGGLPDGSVDADTLAANAVTSGKLASGVGGKILQVVSATKTDAFTTNASAASPAAIGSLGLSITPSSTSNKILLITQIGHTTTSTSNHAAFFYFYKNGSVITNARGDDASTSNRQVSFYTRVDQSSQGTTAGMIYLDSPSSTSALTYQIYCSVESGGGYVNVNRSANSSTSESFGRTISTITAMEIAA